MRVSDLIPDRDFLLTREYWNRENHVVSASGKHQFGDPRMPSYSAQDKDEHPSPSPSASASGDRWPQENPDRPLGAEGVRGNRNQLQPGGQDAEDTPGRSSGSGDTGDDAQAPLDNSGGADDQSKKSDARKATDIVRNDAEINWHYASIERLDAHDLSPRLIAFQLGNAIDNKDSPDNQLLQAGEAGVNRPGPPSP